MVSTGLPEKEIFSILGNKRLATNATYHLPRKNARYILASEGFWLGEKCRIRAVIDNLTPSYQMGMSKMASTIFTGKDIDAIIT